MTTLEMPGARPTRDRLLGMFRETATEVVEKDFHHVLESAMISELSIDSLGILEIIGQLERHLRIQIPDESLSGIQTVRDLLDEVERRLTGPAAL
ncbi:MAG: acyl carrier protein [Polyangiaceae bacterium]